MRERKLWAVIAVLAVLLAVTNYRRVIFILSRHRGNPESIIHSAYYKTKISMFEAMKNNTRDIIFLGDSITDFVNFDDFFPGRVINRGIAGDTTAGVLARLGEVISRRPRKLFVLIGTNDIASGSSTAEISGNVRKIISRVHDALPDTKIYVQSLFPSNVADRPIAKITALNAELKEIARLTNCTYIDLFPLLLADGKLDEKFTLDGLHLNGPAVSRWLEFVAPYLDE